MGPTGNIQKLLENAFCVSSLLSWYPFSLLNGSSKVPTLEEQTPETVQRHSLYLKPSSGHKITGVHTEASSLPWLGAQIKKPRIKKTRASLSLLGRGTDCRTEKANIPICKAMCRYTFQQVYRHSLPSPAKQLWGHHLGTLPSESGDYVFAQIPSPTHPHLRGIVDLQYYTSFRC